MKRKLFIKLPRVRKQEKKKGKKKKKEKKVSSGSEKWVVVSEVKAEKGMWRELTLSAQVPPFVYT